MLDSELLWQLGAGRRGGLPGPALGPWGEGGCFQGAGTQIEGVVLPIVLVQRPQDRLLRADGLQPRGRGHGAAQFLQLVFVALRLLLEGLHTPAHVVLGRGSLAAQVGDEACESRQNPRLQRGLRLCPNAPKSGPATWQFPG